MAKSGSGFDPSVYAPVAERIRLFWESFPNGRITTHLVSRSDQEVVFEARVYRSATDTEPAATGWAAEREGDGEVNTVACLENTETSAVGRALANLGFTAAKERPSAEEMYKAMRARPRPISRCAADPTRSRTATFQGKRASIAEALDVYRLDDTSRQSYSHIVSDLLHLIERGERSGLRSKRAQHWRELLVTEQFRVELLTACERRLRGWIARTGS
jgi:hypothetical protein